MIGEAAGTGGASLLCFCSPEPGDETWEMVALVVEEEHETRRGCPAC